MVVTDARNVLDNAMGTIDASLQASMQEMLKGKPVSAAQKQILDEMRGKVAAL
jgi:hypothetical protein